MVTETSLGLTQPILKRVAADGCTLVVPPSPRSRIGHWRIVAVLTALLGAVFLAWSAQAAAAAQTPGLVSEWEGNGNANDSVGTSNGTLVDGGYAAGQNGQQAFNLDGADDYVSIPSSAMANVTSAISVSAWVRPASLPSGPPDESADIFSQYDTHDMATSFDLGLAQGGQIDWGVTGQSCDWLGGGARAVETTVTIPVGQWTQVVGTFDPSTQQLHVLINGQAVGTQMLDSATVPSLCSAGSPLRIGVAQALGGELRDFFNGEIQDVKLYNQDISGGGPGGGVYVAMGDSYSAGEGADFPSGPGCSSPLYLDPSGSPTNTDYLANARCIPTPVVPPGPDDTCHRAITAYPHLVASALGLTLKFVACSGAVTDDAYAANHANAIEPAQLSALNPNVRLVTLSFGGNDINFAGVVGGCVTPGKTAVDCIGVDQDELRLLGYDTSVGTADDGRLISRIDTADKRQAKSLLSRFGQPSGTGASAALLHDAAAFSKRLSVHDRLVFLLRAIRGLAPKARILVLGYPRWFDPGGSSHDVEHFKPLEQRWLNDRIRVADEAIRDAVRQSGVAQYVDVYGAFAGHELSGSTTIWPVDADGHAICHGPGTYINGVDFVAHQLFNSPELMHPNPCGHVAFARAVEDAYGLPHSITRPVAPVLPPGAHIQVTSHHSSFFKCRETFHAQVASGALSRVRTFDWYNDGGDLVTDVGSGRHATMTMSAHSAFHFLLVIHGTNGQNRYIAHTSNVLC